MKLSIVTTLYKSESYIDEFYKRITKSALELTDSFEIVFVDDGSPDNSLDVATSLSRRDRRVKVVQLSRNYGHHKAIMTGLRYAKGEKVFLIDSDLEERPELLVEFWKKLESNPELDLVYGVQAKRRGNKFEKYSGALFYKLVNSFVSQQIPVNFCTVRIMTRDFVNNIACFNEREMTLIDIMSVCGFNQSPIEITKDSSSPTTYSLSAKIRILVNVITSSSSKPLYFVFYFGLLIFLLSLFSVLLLVLNKVINDVEIEGWTSIMMSIWTIGGLIVFSQGVIGIYLSKIFIETKNRPYTIVRKIYEEDHE